MKKILILLSALSIVALVSCKKDYTCTCTALIFSFPTTIEKTTKSDAEKQCQAIEDDANTAEDGEIVIPATCSID